MPGNEVEGGIHESFVLVNSSQGQHLVQSSYGNQQVLNYDQYVLKQRQVGASLNELHDYRVKDSDSIRYDAVDSASLNPNQNCQPFIVTPGYTKIPSQTSRLCLNQPHFNDTSYEQINLKFGASSINKLLQETESCDSPTLTATSERSEVTEASTDFNFLQGQEQQLSRQQVNLLQVCPMQQSGYSDMQLLQQHIMLKQLHDLQRQQQFSQLGDVRQPSALNPFSAVSKHPGGLPLINGTPVQDAPHMFMNLMQGGANLISPGFPNRFSYTQEQGQGQPSVGLVSPHPDPSLYGTPVSSTRGGVSQSSQLQGISNDAFKFLTKDGDTGQKSVNEYIISPDHIRVPQGNFPSRQWNQTKDMFGSFDVQALSSGTISGNFDSSNTRTNAVSKDTTRQEQSGWPLVQQKTVQPGHPHGLVPLDPIEEKILYNMDENPWDASFIRPPASVGGNFGNIMENTDFSSIQSGSWSALMQSAVAEASSSDNGLQEEWSGLTYQNTERSTDNQLSNFIDGHRQKNSWEDANMQKASSFGSKPSPIFAASGTSSSFPGFPHQGYQFSTERRENLLQEGSQGSFESKSPKASAEWVDRSAQRRTASNDDDGKYEEPKGKVSENKLKEEDPDGCSWKTDVSHRISYSRSCHVEQVETEADYNMLNRESFQKTHNPPSIGQMHVNNNQPNYMERIGISTTSGNETLGRNQQQIVGAKPSGGESETCENQQKSGHMLISSARGMGAHDQGHSAEGILVSEEFAYRGDHNVVGPNGSDNTSPNSQNIELHHRVDHSREGNSPHSIFRDSNTLTQNSAAETRRPTASTYTQSSASQGFSLRLAPPSQGMANPNNFLSSQGLPQVMSYSNPRTVNSELPDKSQTWVAMPSLGGQLDGNQMPFGQSGGPFYFNTQGSSVAARNSPFGNQPHIQQVSTVPVVSQASHAAADDAFNRSLLFNVATSQDNVPDAHTSHYSQHIPVDAVPTSQPSVLPSMSHLGELSTIQNAWPNEPNHKNLPGLMPQSKPSTLPSSTGPLHISHGFGFKTGRESSQLESASEMTSRLTLLSQGGDFSRKHTSDVNAFPIFAQASHSQWDGFNENDKQHPISSGRNSSPATGSSLSITAFQRSLPVPDPIMSNHRSQESASPTGQKFYEHDMTSKIPAGGGPNSVLTGATNMLSFLRGSGEDPRAKSFSQPSLQNIASHEIDRSGQSSSSNIVAPHVSGGHIDPHMAPTWFRQYGTFGNGQMPPSAQLSFWKAPLNLHIHDPAEQVSTTDSSPAGSMKPSAAAPLPIGPQLSALSVMPNVNIQSIHVKRSNKRKSMTSDIFPWHHEVTQGCQRRQNISIREREWPQATNHLYEKVEAEFEPLENVRQMHRSKRRLILSMQLMQQLVHPAPQSILFAKASSHYESLLFFISRLTLGDACSLSHDLRSGFQLPSGNNEICEKHRTSISAGHQMLSELLEEFTDRAKRMETDFQRLDRTTSIVDVRVECQDIERFSLINRFARFHVRGQTQADTSAGASSSGAPKPLPQRYVSALPLPRNIPEEAQCLPL